MGKRVQKKSKSKNKGSLNRYVFLCFGVLIAYTIIDLIIFLIKGEEPYTLTQYIFTVFGCELGFCMVKAILNKKGYKSNGDDGFTGDI